MDLMINDITQIKEHEKEKSVSKLKQCLFSKIAHEFKTPIIIITAKLDELEEEIYSLNSNYGAYKAISLSNKIFNIKILSQFVIYLVNDMVEYTKETNQVNLNIQNTNIIKIIEFCL